MAQQSDTEPRGAPKRQGKLTHEQQQRIINKQENTKGTDAPLPGETLKHAAKRYPKPGPGTRTRSPMVTARSSAAPTTKASTASAGPTSESSSVLSVDGS